jgi:hypothetical protein
LDYQSNSRKSRERPEKPDKLEPVVTGPVIQKEKSVGRKFKDVFFGGDFRSSAVHVAADVFLPALRQLAYDIVVEGVKGVIFGESAYRRQAPTNYRSYTQYNTPSALPRPDPRYRSSIITQTTARLPDQRPYRTYADKPDVNQIILYSRPEAENVLERMTDVIDNYDVASVADLYDTLNLESSPIDNKWGWRYLHNTEIRQVREGFLLDLPPVEPI